MKLLELFQDKQRAKCVKAKHFKASASEGLSLYHVIAYFIVTLVMSRGVCMAACRCYLRLVDVIDCLLAINDDSVTPQTLLTAVELFLDAFDEAFSMSWSTPKFHWMLHFADHLRKFGKLVACWPLERKHKTAKRYSADVHNTRVFEVTTLSEVTCDHLARLDDPDTFIWMQTGLVKKRPATKKLISFVCNQLDLDADETPVVYSSEAMRFAVNCLCHVGDCVLVEQAPGDFVAGEVWAHIEVEGVCMSVVSLWKMLSFSDKVATWRYSLSAELIWMEDIRASLIWRKTSDTEVSTIVPDKYCA